MPKKSNSPQKNMPTSKSKSSNSKNNQKNSPAKNGTIQHYQIEAIVVRLMANMKGTDIAKELHVSNSTVSKVKRKWKNGEYDGQLSDENMEKLQKRLANMFFEKAHLALKTMTPEKMGKMNAYQLSGIAGNMFQQGRAASQNIQDSSIIKKIVIQVNNEPILKAKKGNSSQNTDRDTDHDTQIIDVERVGDEYITRKNTDQSNNKNNRPGGGVPGGD